METGDAVSCPGFDRDARTCHNTEAYRPALRQNFEEARQKTSPLSLGPIQRPDKPPVQGLGVASADNQLKLPSGMGLGAHESRGDTPICPARAGLLWKARFFLSGDLTDICPLRWEPTGRGTGMGSLNKYKCCVARSHAPDPTMMRSQVSSCMCIHRRPIDIGSYFPTA